MSHIWSKNCLEILTRHALHHLDEVANACPNLREFIEEQQTKVILVVNLTIEHIRELARNTINVNKYLGQSLIAIKSIPPTPAKEDIHDKENFTPSKPLKKARAKPYLSMFI